MFIRISKDTDYIFLHSKFSLDSSCKKSGTKSFFSVAEILDTNSFVI